MQNIKLLEMIEITSISEVHPVEPGAFSPYRLVLTKFGDQLYIAEKNYFLVKKGGYFINKLTVTLHSANLHSLS
jgi:hypothetical protein